jgi:hypothetical protein
LIDIDQKRVEERAVMFFGELLPPPSLPPAASHFSSFSTPGPLNHRTGCQKRGWSLYNVRRTRTYVPVKSGATSVKQAFNFVRVPAAPCSDNQQETTSGARHQRRELPRFRQRSQLNHLPIGLGPDGPTVRPSQP